MFNELHKFHCIRIHLCHLHFALRCALSSTVSSIELHTRDGFLTGPDEERALVGLIPLSLPELSQ